MANQSIDMGFFSGLISQYKNGQIIAANTMKVSKKDTGSIPKNIEHAEAVNKITMIEGISNFSFFSRVTRTGEERNDIMTLIF